jgi:hypothetical protein
MMDTPATFTRRLSVLLDTAHFFTDSIDVCAVTIMNDALYKDIRLSGNQMRVPWARRPHGRVRGAAARQALGARKRDAAKR